MVDWDVQSWLEEIGYDKRYAQAFIDNGYDLPNLCANLKDEDLDAIEVDTDDRNRLFEHVARLRHYSFARVPISYDTPMSNGNISTSHMNINGTFGGGLSPSTTKLSLDSLSASQEPSVKSPDSLASVSHELPEHPSPLTTEVQLYSEALNQSSTHVPKKPPRSFKNQGKQIPPPLPASSSTGALSKLQLKLKLKQELQQDHIVITEPPYVQESGEPNEMLLQQLAVDYAERFRIDSLEMYEAMIELWRVQTNQSAQVTPMNGMDAPKVSPGHDKATAVQKQPPAQSSTYMDPYNGPPTKPSRRPAPPVPRNKRSSDKGKVERSGENVEADVAASNLNSPLTSNGTSSMTSPKSLLSSSESCAITSPPSTTDIFVYEDVDEPPENLSGVKPSYVTLLEEPSAEKEHTSVPQLQKVMTSSESVPVITNHVTSNKVPSKKRGGLKKFLSRNSKKKLLSLPLTTPNGANGEMLAAATITMNDEERLKLMEKFKKHELSETQVLSKVTAYEEEQRSKRDALFTELSQEADLPLSSRSSRMSPLEKNVALASKSGKLLVPSNANIKRSQSTEAVDNISLSSSTSSSSDVDPTSTSHKPGVIASALKFFKKRGKAFKDNSKNAFNASNLTHSSSMPSIVIQGKLNELNNKVENKVEKPPPSVPSAYSEVFDRILPDGGSSSLPRSGSGSNSGSISSSSSTLPSRGSPVTPPSVKTKQTPVRYRHKQQQHQEHANFKRTSPLTQTKTDLTRVTEQQRQSSPEILICTVTDTGVPIKWENEEQEQSDITQEQSKEDEVQCNKKEPQPTKKPASLEILSNASDVESKSLSTTTAKPAIPSRPKIPPKPSIPATSRTDKLFTNARSVDHAVLQNKSPVPKPRAKTPSDEGRYCCSPVFDDELDLKQVPPTKPPRRRNTQMSSRSSRDTPSPVPNRHTVYTTSPPSAYSLDSHRELFSPPLPTSKPMLPPKPRRTSSSTSTIGLESPLVEVADHLNADDIDLANIPYSTTWGECGIPVPLIARYAHELNSTFNEMAQYLDRVRRHRLEQCQRVWVPMQKDYAVNNQKVDTSSLQAWTVSIGLPMYYSNLTKIGFCSVESMKKLSPKTYSQIQFRRPRHGQLLHKAIQDLYRN